MNEIIKNAKAVVSDRQQLNKKYTLISFEMKQPHDFRFIAGQFISLTIPGTEERRSYSLASRPVTHGFQIFVDITPQGPGTQYIDSLQPGHEIEFIGPMGQFVIKDDPEVKEEALIFVGTGCGVAPLRSMIMDQLQNKNDTREMWLYWGLRHADDIALQEEFEDIDEDFKNFHFHLTLSQPPQGWPLCSGHVNDCVQVHKRPKKAGYYICGNPAMIDNVRKLLIKLGENEQNIHYEKF